MQMDGPICLIVDDEPAIRAYLSKILNRGISNLESKNAVEALRIPQRPGCQIDSLLSDSNLPGGMDLAYSAKNMFPGYLLSRNLSRPTSLAAPSTG